MIALSVAIIARDEERHIGDAIASVAGLADEVVVLLDDRTSDRTAAICAERGARVLLEPWRGFSGQHNYALSICQGAWVLFLDADERVQPELAGEIRSLLASPPDDALAGCWIPRHNLFFGRPVRGGGWYPDHQLRLLRRGRAHFDERRLVHEVAQVDGDLAFLKGHMIHVNIERVGELWRKQASYALQEARMLQQEGRRARWRNFVGAPAREFVRRYVRLGGWRDGWVGLLLCGTLAYFEIVKFGYLMRLGKKSVVSEE